MSQQTEIKKWFEKSDTTFKTLIMPAAFVITITWTFLFFMARIALILDPNAITVEFLQESYVKTLARHIMIFTFSIFLWIWSIFARDRPISKLWKLKIKWITLPIILKWFSLSLVWLSIILIPVSIYISSIAPEVGLEISQTLINYLVIVLFAITFAITSPPRTGYRIKKKKRKKKKRKKKKR